MKITSTKGTHFSIEEAFTNVELGAQALGRDFVEEVSTRKTGRGASQGEILSPLLWNRGIN